MSLDRSFQRSTPNDGDQHWHGRGFRADGNMYLNAQVSYGHVEHLAVNEHATLTQLSDQITTRCTQVMTAHGQYPLPQGWTMGLFDPRGLVVIRSDVRHANTLFNGGETINVTVFDNERTERVYEPFRGWVFPHESPRWAALMEESNLESYFFRSLHLFARHDRQRALDEYLRRLQQECTLREFCTLLESFISLISTTTASNTIAS